MDMECSLYGCGIIYESCPLLLGIQIVLAFIKCSIMNIFAYIYLVTTKVNYLERTELCVTSGKVFILYASFFSWVVVRIKWLRRITGLKSAWHIINA